MSSLIIILLFSVFFLCFSLLVFLFLLHFLFASGFLRSSQRTLRIHCSDGDVVRNFPTGANNGAFAISSLMPRFSLSLSPEFPVGLRPRLSPIATDLIGVSNVSRLDFSLLANVRVCVLRLNDAERQCNGIIG